LISAIQANLCAFQLSVRRERQNAQQSKEIEDLKDECDALKKRLADMEKKIKPRDPQKEWKLKERIEALEGLINSSGNNLPEKTVM
jgi:predicted  nucleic acid-binding Zn-ribbon protein